MLTVLLCSVCYFTLQKFKFKKFLLRKICFMFSNWTFFYLHLIYFYWHKFYKLLLLLSLSTPWAETYSGSWQTNKLEFFAKKALTAERSYLFSQKAPCKIFGRIANISLIKFMDNSFYSLMFVCSKFFFYNSTNFAVLTKFLQQMNEKNEWKKFLKNISTQKQLLTLLNSKA